MTKYDEMCEAASTAASRWLQYRDRCWSHMALLVNGLMAYCGIPKDPEHVTFLKWNEATGEDRAYLEPGEGKMYAPLGAIEFDIEDSYWHLGVSITLTRPDLSPQRVFFPLCVTEREGKLMVKLGANGKERQIDQNDPAQLDAFYEHIVEIVKQCFRAPRKPTTKPIGFVVDA
jgi:hypothetical protein